MSKFFSFYLKPDLLSLAMKENLFLYFWSWGWEGVVSCGFFTSWPSASPRWTCLRSGGQESCPETQKAVVQWSGPALGAAMSKHRPFHQDFFHPRPVPLPCKGQMWGIQSPFSSNDFSNVHNSLWSNWTFSRFPLCPLELWEFWLCMNHESLLVATMKKRGNQKWIRRQSILQCGLGSAKGSWICSAV